MRASTLHFWQRRSYAGRALLSCTLASSGIATLSCGADGDDASGKSGANAARAGAGSGASSSNSSAAANGGDRAPSDAGTANGGSGANAGNPSTTGGASQSGGSGLGGTSGGGNAGSPDLPYPLSCKPPEDYPDPTLMGKYKVGTTKYAADSIKLDNVAVSVRAAAWYPANVAGTNTEPVAGKFPTIVMLHGNHARYLKSEDLSVDCSESFSGGRHLTLSEIQSRYPQATEIQSHMGYSYLGEALAKAGYVLVSIDGNDTNCISRDAENPGFVPERAELIRKHAQLLVASTSSADSGLALLSTHLDLEQLLYAGHSRGGEAAVIASYSQVPGTTLRGVISIAPTSFMLDGKRSMSSPLLMILPASDGDVSFNSGMLYYDVTSPSATADKGWFKAQQYLYGANHNFFNSEWDQTFRDCGTVHPAGDNGVGNGDNRLSRQQQEKYLIGIFRTFLAASLTADPMARATLAGNARISNFSEFTVLASYAELGASLPVPNSVTSSGFDQIAKYDFSHTKSAYNDTFFHRTSGYVGTFQSAPAVFAIPINTTEKPRYVSLRVAQVASDALNVQGRKLNLDVELEDSSGRKVRAASNWAGNAILPWYERPDWKSSPKCEKIVVEKTVLGTLLIPAACFRGDVSFAFDALQTLRIQTKEKPGALAFSDFRIVP